MVSVVFEVEYDTDSEEEARAFAMSDADFLFQNQRVLAIAAGLKSEYLAHAAPITERYLEDE